MRKVGDCVASSRSAALTAGGSSCSALQAREAVAALRAAFVALVLVSTLDGCHPRPMAPGHDLDERASAICDVVRQERHGHKMSNAEGVGEYVNCWWGVRGGKLASSSAALGSSSTSSGSVWSGTGKMKLTSSGRPLIGARFH